ncbi:MAG: aspartate aminotransferase family protein, partial [Mesorhizobium sp.]
GVEGADSIVFNPHKWLGAQFDCSIQFLRDPESHVRTLAIKPDYLKTHGHDGIINYSEWSVPLGRRFRALKLWFLLRAHGLENLRLVNAINDDGRIYLTQTKVDGRIAIRFQVGQFEATAADVDTAFTVITEIARAMD